MNFTARNKALLYLAAASIIWGVAGVVIKLTLSGFTPVVFLWYRFILSSIFAIFGIKSIKKIFRNKSTLIAGTVYGLLAAPIGLGLLFLGMNQTAVLNLSLIQLVSPAATAVAAHFFLKEHMTKSEKLGFLLTVVGSLVIAFEPLRHGERFGGTFFGNILLFAYLACDIASIIILKKLLKKNNISSWGLTNYSFILGLVVLTPFAFSNFQSTVSQIFNASLEYHLGVIFMAVFSGTLAFSIRSIAQKTLRVEETVMFHYLIPLVTAPMAFFLLKENINEVFLGGALICVIGVVLAEYKHFSRKALK